MKTIKKKISSNQILRLIAQIVFFISLPGLYINAFSGIKIIYSGILEQNFDFASSFPQLISALSVIPVTLLFGRFFCGWMCAFGTLGDLLYLFSNKVLKISIHVNEKVDRVLKYIKYVILCFIIIAIWSMKFIDTSSLSPWDAFGSLVTFRKLPDFSFVITEFTVGFLLLLTIIGASLFVERFFCRYICPLGAVFTIISKFRFIHIKKPTGQCGSCKACTKHCAMGIPLYQNDTVKSGECISCLKCIDICPRNNAHVTIMNRIKKPVITGLVSISFLICIYVISTVASHNAVSLVNNQTTTATAKTSSNLYNDGTYEGSGIGFRGGTTTVSITIKNDVITGINTISSQDDPPYYDSASESIISQILDSQSTDVDVVSGATFSSKGIIEAVSNALNKALK